MTRTTTLQRSLRILSPVDWSNDQKGVFLEDIAGQILRKQSYEITERVRLTGMEIDLLGVHKPSGEPVYVECKFLQKNVSANVLDLMAAQGIRRNISQLALFSASQLSKDAKGTFDEWKNHDGLSFSFYGPNLLIDTLLDSNLAPKVPDDLPSEISHATLLIHPEHEYLWLFQEQQDGKPSKILVYGMTDPTDESLDKIRTLLDQQELLLGLPIYRYQALQESASGQYSFRLSDYPTSEVVSQVITADDLIDYRPSNPSNFIGRTGLQKEIWDFLGTVRNNSTKTRILSLVGDSGYGKSSLVAKLAERFKNKKWKSKFFLFPVDVRSARGPLFVAEAILAALKAAVEFGFIDCSKKLSIDNVDNILASESVLSVLENLKLQNKVLIIFFDQFEEAFTKDEFFPVFGAFRRFAIDVSASQENLVLGFSWRTGISLSDRNPAYQMWNELRDHRLTKTLDKFDSSESSQLITQFENHLGKKLLPPLRKQLHEQGQGLPWFLKKLCIHVSNQVKRGISPTDLLGSRLNVKVTVPSVAVVGSKQEALFQTALPSRLE